MSRLRVCLSLSFNALVQEDSAGGGGGGASEALRALSAGAGAGAGDGARAGVEASDVEPLGPAAAVLFASSMGAALLQYEYNTEQGDYLLARRSRSLSHSLTTLSPKLVYLPFSAKIFLHTHE